MTEHIAVGIDVSKGKSTVVIMRKYGEIVKEPFDVKHTGTELKDLIRDLKGLDGEVKAVMECTGRYYEPIARALSEAGIFVSAVNPKIIKNYGTQNLRASRNKTDKIDSIKIADFAHYEWLNLREYSAMDDLRQQLKILNTQYDLYDRQATACKNNLKSLVDSTYPGCYAILSDTNPARLNGHKKWVDFVRTFYHAECVSKLSRSKFEERYRKFCKDNRYNFSNDVCQELYHTAKEAVPVLPKDALTKSIVVSAADQLISVSAVLRSVGSKMNEIASQLPEYNVVMAMDGVGEALGPQLMAEIGDVSRFTRREQLTAFAGVDPGTDESGTHSSKSNSTTKYGSPRLRKALFNVMDNKLKRAPEGDPVFEHLDKLRSKGKEYKVYMTAGSNKFLRIYYGRVKEYLKSIDQSTSEADSSEE